MLPRGLRVQDLYPGWVPPWGNNGKESTTIAASSPSLPQAGGTTPTMFLVGVIVLLVAIRIVYEMAPTKGKGL